MLKLVFTARTYGSSVHTTRNWKKKHCMTMLFPSGPDVRVRTGDRCRRPVRTGRSYVPYVRLQKYTPVRPGRTSGPYVRPGRTGRLHRAWRFYDFQNGGRPPCWILKNCSFCHVALVNLPFSFLIQNFPEIGQSVNDLWPKTRFSRWRPPPC